MENGCKLLITHHSETFTQAQALSLTQRLANTVNLFRQSLNNEMDAQVVVALVGGGFAVLVALISKIGIDNKKDHGEVHNTLGRIEQKIDGHIEGHK